MELESSSGENSRMLYPTYLEWAVGGVRRLSSLSTKPFFIARSCTSGEDPSLNEGLGAIAFRRKPSIGIRPSGECCMHIVPPVIIMRTRDSGKVDSDMSLSRRTGAM